MLKEALDYASRGFYVIPLHNPEGVGCSCRQLHCENIGKHPRTRHGLLDASIEEAQILEWWTMWPSANIGIVTGEKSGLVVLDVDKKHDGDKSIAALQAKYEKITERIIAKTGGGGWHLLFKHPGGRVGNIQNTDILGLGIDVRGDGGYIVAPPSRHAEGKRYEWAIEPNGILPEMPVWLKLLLSRPKLQVAPIDIISPPIPEGARNKTLTSLAGSMQRRAMSAEAILAALKTENERRCNPPLSQEEVAMIAKSIQRYPADAPAYVPLDPSGNELPITDVKEGLFSVKDVTDETHLLYDEGAVGGVSTGWRELDTLYTVKPGQWTVITGIPSHGKSAFLDAMLVNIAKTYDWRFVVCSPENQPLSRHIAQLMSVLVGEPFAKGNSNRMSLSTMEQAEDWLDDHFRFVLPSEDDCTVPGILDLFDQAYIDRPFNGVVLDPWNELEHRRTPGKTETEYISESLTRFRRFARRTETHLWIVVHPIKLTKKEDGSYPLPTLYDCAGAAHWRNKADMGITVYRNLDSDSVEVELHVTKVRFRECGNLGSCRLIFDRTTGRYSEIATRAVRTRAPVIDEEMWTGE